MKKLTLQRIDIINIENSIENIRRNRQGNGSTMDKIMTQTPTTKKELENCINYIIQFFAWLDKPIDSDKCFGFHIDDHNTTFVITFGFVIENISQPHTTPPDEIIEPKSDEAKLTIVKGATSFFTLISEVEEVVDYVRSIKLVTELSDRDDGTDW